MVLTQGPQHGVVGAHVAVKVRLLENNRLQSLGHSRGAAARVFTRPSVKVSIQAQIVWNNEKRRLLRVQRATLAAIDSVEERAEHAKVPSEEEPFFWQHCRAKAA
jgi:hypothetical protein